MTARPMGYGTRLLQATNTALRRVSRAGTAREVQAPHILCTSLRELHGAEHTRPPSEILQHRLTLLEAGGGHYSSAASNKMKYSSRIRLSKLEMEEDFLNLMKGLYEERTANTTLT